MVGLLQTEPYHKLQGKSNTIGKQCSRAELTKEYTPVIGQTDFELKSGDAAVLSDISESSRLDDFSF